jgi:hypothetical protein
MSLVVYFRWDCRGKSSLKSVRCCVLPERVKPASLLNGFWVCHANERIWEVIQFAGLEIDGEHVGNDHMWVPPGRITSVINEGEK